MTIEFQCEHCEKLIRAADDQGGALAPCPHCGHSMYVPLPPGQESEPLDLEEPDPAEEAHREQLMNQPRQTVINISKENPADESARPETPTAQSTPRPNPKPLDPEDAAYTVEQYVIAMAHSSLDEAGALAAHLAGHADIVNPIINQALTLGINNPALSNIPAAVQQGFLKRLRLDLNS